MDTISLRFLDVTCETKIESCASRATRELLKGSETIGKYCTKHGGMEMNRASKGNGAVKDGEERVTR